MGQVDGQTPRVGEEFRARETAGEVSVTFDELRAALDRCMSAHPPKGIELRLHPDANRMADLFGLMVYLKQNAAAWAEVAPGIREAFDRWSMGGTDPTPRQSQSLKGVQE